MDKKFFGEYLGNLNTKKNCKDEINFIPNELITSPAKRFWRLLRMTVWLGHQPIILLYRRCTQVCNKIMCCGKFKYCAYIMAHGIFQSIQVELTKIKGEGHSIRRTYYFCLTNKKLILS